MRSTLEAKKSYLGMDTAITHVAYGKNAERAITAAQRESVRLEGLLSRFIPGSDIDRLNRAAGAGFVKLNPETVALLQTALDCAQNTQGCFDVTVGPAVRLWKRPGASIPPPEEELRAACALIGFANLRTNRRASTASLAQAGQSVDLGGIGKGYAADRTLRIMRKHGVVSAFTDIGGNVATLGSKPDGSPWRIGLRHPRMENSLLGVLMAVNQSVVTSGDDQRYVLTPDGMHYHHILDPRTGMPSESGLCSVTVVADNSTLADALSTALFIAGMRRGISFLARYPGAQVIFVDHDLSVFLTGGLAERFESTQGSKANVI